MMLLIQDLNQIKDQLPIFRNILELHQKKYHLKIFLITLI